MRWTLAVACKGTQASPKYLSFPRLLGAVAKRAIKSKWRWYQNASGRTCRAGYKSSLKLGSLDVSQEQPPHAHHAERSKWPAQWQNYTLAPFGKHVTVRDHTRTRQLLHKSYAVAELRGLKVVTDSYVITEWAVSSTRTWWMTIEMLSPCPSWFPLRISSAKEASVRKLLASPRRLWTEMWLESQKFTTSQFGQGWRHDTKNVSFKKDTTTFIWRFPWNLQTLFWKCTWVHL